MNRYTQNVIAKFRSDENKAFLFSSLIDQFNDAKVYKYLQENFDSLVDDFLLAYTRELNNSDPIVSLGLVKQVHLLNRKFLNDRAELIQLYFQGIEKVPEYVVGDGLPTGRRPASAYNLPADLQLARWYVDAGRGVTARDDIQGNDSSPYYWASGIFPQNGINTYPARGQPYHPADPPCCYAAARRDCRYPTDVIGKGRAGPLLATALRVPPSLPTLREGMYGRRMPTPADGPAITGVSFCDQSNVGTSNHVEMLFGSSAISSLNRDGFYTGIVGDSTPEQNAGLLSRRIFRSNECGIENGIPNYEKRLYNREYERSIGENLEATEYGAIVYANDMRSLFERVDRRREYNRQHDHDKSHSGEWYQSSEYNWL